MSMEMKTFLFCGCWVVAVAAFAWLLVQRRLDKQTIMEKDKTIAGLKDFNCRLYDELRKAKGVDGPFVMPEEEPEPGPDFDVAQIFAVENATECEEPEKRCDSGCKAELDAG